MDTTTGVMKNLGLAGDDVLNQESEALDTEGPLLFFSVSERAQAGKDLNGDGDTIDSVYHVYDHRTGVTTNLGVATNVSPISDAGLTAISVNENRQGQDLNGDSDTDDLIIFTYDDVNGLKNTQVQATSPLWVSGTRIAFLLSEPITGTDLNGDSDMDDIGVYHIFDTITSSVTNLQLASPNKFVISRSSVLFQGDQLTFLVNEIQQKADLNGDGDMTDFRVPHVYDAAMSTITNVGIDIATMFVDGTTIGMSVYETDPYEAEPPTDMNNDGDVDDTVLWVYNTTTHLAQNLGLAHGKVFPYQVDGNLVVTAVLESDQGGTDLNNDGDALDNVVFVHDTTTGATINLQLGIAAPYGFRLDDGMVALLVSESGHGDLNSDGDALDEVLHVYDAGTAALTNVGVAGYPSSISIEGSVVGFAANEASEASTDLNGDGDKIDSVAHIYNHDLDGDGLPNGEDPDMLADVIITLPLGVFSNQGDPEGQRNAFLEQLENIEDSIASGDTNAAVRSLQNLRKKVNGCGTAADRNDWITDCVSQLEVRDLMDQLIANLEG